MEIDDKIDTYIGRQPLWRIFTSIGAQKNLTASHILICYVPCRIIIVKATGHVEGLKWKFSVCVRCTCQSFQFIFLNLHAWFMKASRNLADILNVTSKWSIFFSFVYNIFIAFNFIFINLLRAGNSENPSRRLVFKIPLPRTCAEPRCALDLRTQALRLYLGRLKPIFKILGH